jgi:adenylate kinase family enzyme
MELERVVVVGCSGSGKSTFARLLAKCTGLPLFHLDQEYWSPGWVERYATDQAWLARVGEIAAGDRWIIDGNYSASFPMRLPRATAIFWLDRTQMQCMGSIIRRLLVHYGRVRESSAPGCPERWDWEFVKFVWNWHATSGSRLCEVLARPEYAPLVRRFRSYRTGDGWLAALTAEAIGTGC